MNPFDEARKHLLVAACDTREGGKVAEEYWTIGKLLGVWEARVKREGKDGQA